MTLEAEPKTTQTEFPFKLKIGYQDSEGVLHKNGIMKLATAAVEIFVENDPRVKANKLYATILILSQVVIKLGTLRSITPDVIENLYSIDYRQLVRFYEKINGYEQMQISTVCPKCGNKFETETENFL